MKSKRENPIRITEKLVWIAIGLAALFWILESAVHVFVFHEGRLVQQIMTPQSYEIWMRLIVMVIFIAFAMYAQFIIVQRRRAEEASKHANAELNQIFNTAADGMRMIDKHFNVLRNNQTFLTLSGVSESDAAGSVHTGEEYGGTRLGLAIVRKAADKLRASLRLESKPGEGSTFFVALPKTQKEK